MVAATLPTPTKRADDKPALDTSPVRFRVVTPMFFRGERIPAGATIAAELGEAVELCGNHHVEQVSKVDSARIYEMNGRAIAALDRASGPRGSSWITGQLR